MFVVEPVHGLLEREPAKLVDLIVRTELPADDSHEPPADQLPPVAGIEVSRGRQLFAGLALQSGFLLNLSQRRVKPPLTWVQLALRQRPVVITWPMDECDLGECRSSIAGRTPIDPHAVANDHAARRSHLRFTSPSSLVGERMHIATVACEPIASNRGQSSSDESCLEWSHVG